MIVTSTSTQRFKNITDDDLNKIINSNKIIKYIKNFYADAVIKHTVRWKLHATGLPYFKLLKILPDLKKTENNNYNKEDLKIEDFITSSKTQDVSFYYHNRHRHNDRLLSLHNDGIKEEEEKEEINQKYTCILCFSHNVNICIIPCKHMIACHQCISKICNNKCPYCNCNFEYIIRINDNHTSEDDDDDDDDKKPKPKKRKLTRNRNFEKFRCKICFAKFAEIICLPCKHLCVCLNCFTMQNNNVNWCPKCCKKVTNNFKPIMP